LLCVGGRRNQLGHVVDPVLPRRIPRPPRRRWVSVRPRGLDGVGWPGGSPVSEVDKVELVNLTIDGIEVSAPKGSLVIRAAEQIGTRIPRFCGRPLLAPVGACRRCLVEVALPGPDGTMRQMQGPPGRMKPQASCTLAVSEGMQVNTQLTSAGA